MELRKRLALVALAYLVLFLVSGWVITSVMTEWTQRLDERRMLLVTDEQVSALRGAYLDQETGQRGFVITGDPSFLDPYEQGQREAASLTDKIALVLRGQDLPSQLIDNVVDAAGQWHADAAEPAIDARRAGEEADAAAMVESGRALFDELRTRVDVLDQVTDARLADIEAAARDARVDVVAAIAVVIGLVVLMTAVVAWLLQRWVVRPLERITDATQRLGRGEVATIEITGPAELREVATAIDQMQTTILRQRDQAIYAREAVEQNAVLAVQLRNELAHEVGEYPQGWTVAAGLRAAEGIVAGDCYDVSLLGPTEIGLVVLDISGHGALAAVSAFRCKELLKVALRNGFEPGAALDWLAAQELDLDEGFFTAFVVTIDTVTGRCRYANAGHPPALMVDGERNVRSLDPTGPLFGPVPPGWRTIDTELPKGTVLAIYTDGLTEARNPERQFYGEQRMVTLIAEMECREAQGVVDHILRDLRAFHSGRVQDDVTLVVLCRGD